MGRALEIATAYATGIISGEIVAGRLMHLAAQRFLDDWEHRERKGLRWSDERADDALGVIECARHFQGKQWTTGADEDGHPCTHGDDCDACTHPHRFNPQPWQVFHLANIFGWLVEREGRWVRRFRKSYREVARKNGKTFDEAACANYLTFWDGETGAQGFSAATHRDQAKYAYRAIERISQRTPDYAHGGVRSRGDVETPRSTPKLIQESTGATFEPLGRENDNLDGARPHVAIIDEYHQHKTDGVVGAMETGQGSGLEPLLAIITTAGESLESPCGEERNYAIQVLTGALTDESYYAEIHALDEGDDWTDEAVWPKANPNLGVSVSAEFLRSAVRQAIGSPVKQAEVQRKHFNLWRSDPKKAWIPLDIWDRCAKAVPEEELDGQECFGGVDLASIKDTTSFVLVFPPTEERPAWVVRPQVFIPAANLKEREKRDRAPYGLWARDGEIVLSEAHDGEAVDYSLVRQAANDAAERYNLREIGFDPWNATHVATEMQEDGLVMVQVRQGFKTLSWPLAEFERLVRARRVAHGGHRPLRWMMDNVSLRTDDNENACISKKRSTGRNDAPCATIIAMSRALAAVDTSSVYERRGVLSVG